MAEVMQWFVYVFNIKVSIFGYTFSKLDIIVACLMISVCFYFIRKLMDI